GQNADAVLAHAPGGMGYDFMFILEFDPKHGIRQQFRDHAGELKHFFFRHSLPLASLHIRAIRHEFRAKPIGSWPADHKPFPDAETPKRSQMRASRRSRTSL